MKPAAQLLVAAALALVACIPAVEAKPAPKKHAAPASNPLVEPLKDSMLFYLARGEPNSCGAGCSEWIAAEGTINNGTSERLRIFLKRQKGKRPIYFYSPGGITSESVSMGRLLREYGLTARVGRTVPQGCESNSKGCHADKRSGRELTARLTGSQAQCNSACVYAIVGARVREIGPEVHLGIHASKTVIYGHLPPGFKISAEMRAGFKAENRQKIRRYLVDMGIKPALLDEAEKIPHESIKPLTREQMVRFGIDTRNFVESSWTYHEEKDAKGGGVVFKSFEAESGGSDYRRTMLRLTCLEQNQFLLGYAREVGPAENSFLPMKIVAANDEFKLAPPRESVASNDHKRFYDVRAARVPTQVFQTATSEGRIEVASEETEARPAVKLSTLGLASALSALRCVPH